MDRLDGDIQALSRGLAGMGTMETAGTMTVETTDELAMVREQARRFLEQHAGPEHIRSLLDKPGAFDDATWNAAVELGWPLLSAPEALGGLGLGLAGLAVLAEELGRRAVSLPLIPAFVCLSVLADSSADASISDDLGADIATGARIVCLALAEAGEAGLPSRPLVTYSDGKLNGSKSLAPFAAVADLALVSAWNGNAAVLVLVELAQDGVERGVAAAIDNARGAAQLSFQDATGICLDAGDTQSLMQQAAALSALATAFEQLGGAEDAMYMARDYALERKVFGQPIGSFQAIKHNIADMYWRVELARGCALDAQAAFETGAHNWQQLAAAARLGAIEAYEFSSTENIQTHGGLGATWEGNPHIHYRRSRALALELGSRPYWRDLLVGPNGFGGPGSAGAEQSQDVSAELHEYRLRARQWLADNAPAFSGEVRRGLSFEQDLALGRRWQALKSEAGYAAINLPAKWGGGGQSELHKIVFGEEELRYQLPIEYFVISTAQCMAIFLRYGAEEFTERLAPLAIRGEHIWCQMFSEPGAGSDLAALRLKAVRENRDGVEGWVLNGQKLWTSWAHVAHWGFILTRTNPEVPKHAGITAFFLDMATPGITVRPIRRMAGHDDVSEVFFDNVFIPDTQRLGPVDRGFHVAMEMLMVERIAGVYDESLGGTSLDQLLQLTLEARINGQPAIADAQVRALLAEGFVERQGLRSIYRRAMAEIERGGEPGPEGGIRKLVLGRARQRLGALAMDLGGAQGALMDPEGDFRTDFAWSWLDPAGRIAGGTDEILLNAVAERVLGLPQEKRADKKTPFNQLGS
jgi:alkylation response protein AidB-like acyl-CoA dehydrogenase